MEGGGGSGSVKVEVDTDWLLGSAQQEYDADDVDDAR